MTDQPTSCAHQPACHDPAVITYIAGTPGKDYWRGAACERHRNKLYTQAAKRGHVQQITITDAPEPAQASLFPP